MRFRVGILTAAIDVHAEQASSEQWANDDDSNG